VRADLAEARSQQAQAEADLATHAKALQRLEELFEAGIRSRAELEAQQLEVTQDRARVTQAEALVRQQQARVRAAETRARIAGQTVAREERLARSGVLSRREIVPAQGALDTARLEARQAQADLNAARQAVQSARASLAALGAAPGGGNTVPLTASINGVITEREAAVGETVGPDKALFTLLNPSVVVVEGDVFEQDLPRVRSGVPARITTDAAPGRTFSGRVRSVSATVNPETRAARARIAISNPDGVLRPGTFVRALLVTDARAQTVTVPDAAVQQDGGLKVVYVKNGDTFERREVAVGESAGGRTQIKSGVRPGEQVVTTGAYQLRAVSRQS
jgi:cobalt-zinc-cadmium efflux system membrane fusion protein